MEKLVGGEAQLLFVAALYGSLTVSFRLLYAMEGPPCASVASFVRGMMAAACFLPVLLRNTQSSSSSSASSSASSSSFWLAASELAMWNLGAQGLLNVGLLFTEASRASFLTQTSVVLTPLVAMVGGDKVGKNVWFGCLLALIGVVTLASAESSAAAAAAAGTLGINIGDAFCLAGALSWSMYIFRLTCIMEKGGDSVRIQAWKTIILGGLYGLWALADAVKAVGAGQTVSSLWPGAGAGSLTAWIILLFSAVGPGAIADVMQARAQEKVPRPFSNLLLHLHATTKHSSSCPCCFCRCRCSAPLQFFRLCPFPHVTFVCTCPCST
ncbi:hypothetical protein GUITHDRAFT_80436 [Guillardia theta CCMP2712]|uniref:EamA domain-containing protein n=1 Tax=Guillardia theta (strain CCMP2712) TaxID=905079 RepID=L1IEP7_GUITC|nr:hypothetical protein GUITHDRAFT_80436 [Guillardia theta CCMP2712]EKX34567.1 hypothetical protein GUITHDRAFT_80436 [Guillardia theta CCMP2712]|eukprot:XP_005821547.1 hypothetical protein GUITHDRAFT_80436 [Guillardia theta CCMP2712]